MSDRYYPTPIGEVPSVTTILAILSHSFLIPWILNQIRACLDTMMYPIYHSLSKGIQGEDNGGIVKMLDYVFKAHSRATQAAASVGTAFHHVVECLHTCEIPRRDLKRYIRAIEEHTNISQRVCDMAYGWANLLIKKKVVILSSEVFVYSATHRYGGTLDGTWVIDGHEYVIDYKTSNGINVEYLYQAEAYRRAHNELFKTNIQRRAIVWVRKTGEVMLLRIDPARNEHDWQCFLSALRLFNSDKDNQKPTGRLYFDKRRLSDRVLH
jgi:hypothetical protein